MHGRRLATQRSIHNGQRQGGQEATFAAAAVDHRRQEENMENYKVIKALGKGTWGVVHMAEQKGTGRVVAIKKIKSERAEEGVNFTAVREIKLLREFRHENIIELVDCFTTPDLGVCLVYECAFTDLEKILNNKSIPISMADTKQHMLSLLSAISACHDRWILHRDLKPDVSKCSRWHHFERENRLPSPGVASCLHRTCCF
jgi:serine/threonine protein kinase